MGPAGTALSAAALPLELCFRAVVVGRAAAHRSRLLEAHRPPVPVVSVGNLSVGGTGKTPVVAWLVRVLREEGHSPAIAMRGHGGDEQLLHARWNPSVPVHVDRDRVRAVRKAARDGADVVVLDDGFQHLRLARDLDIVLLAPEQPFPAPVLPRGPYREPPGALRRADWIVVTRRVASARDAERLQSLARELAPNAHVARARLIPGGWRDLAGRPAEPPCGAVLAVAGVAGPEAFATLVGQRTGARVELLAFPDHHPYDAADVGRITRRAAGRALVVTEKDAVKLIEHAAALPDARVLALDVELESGEADLRAAIARSVATHPSREGR
jgi:tetraacyldisaccharide 4'-kinase